MVHVLLLLLLTWLLLRHVYVSNILVLIQICLVLGVFLVSTGSMHVVMHARAHFVVVAHIALCWQVVMLWRVDLSAAPGEHHAAGLAADAARGASGGGAGRGRKGSAAADRPRPKDLIMQHAGHRRGKVVDFQWCPGVEWALMSVSDDSADEDVGGGSLQVRACVCLGERVSSV
jgi:hypothetical protein